MDLAEGALAGDGHGALPGCQQPAARHLQREIDREGAVGIVDALAGIAQALGLQAGEEALPVMLRRGRPDHFGKRIQTREHHMLHPARRGEIFRKRRDFRAQNMPGLVSGQTLGEGS
jgi:hypothetical protein